MSGATESLGRRIAVLALLSAIVLTLLATNAAVDGSTGINSAGRSALDLSTAYLAKVDEFVASEMTTIGVPAVAAGVVAGGEVVYAKGFGEADESGRAVTAHTAFILGSLSKSFTALAVMQLVEAGRLDLDGHVQRYLGWFAVADPAASAHIAVRELLNQTSGLSTQTGESSARLLEQAKEAFVSGLSVALVVGALASTASVLVVLAVLPGQATETADDEDVALDPVTVAENFEAGVA